MRKYFLLGILFIVTANSYGQKTQPSVNTTANLNEHKNQKQLAWILLGGGAVLMANSFLIPEGEETFNLICLCYNHKNRRLKTVLLAAGAASSLVSIPLFVSAKKNRKVVAVNFRPQQAIQLYEGYFMYSYYPSASFYIRF